MAYNPLFLTSPEELAARIVALMPTGDVDSPEEDAAAVARRAEAAARYKEARWGALPADEYRILDQGSLLGWYYELEVAGETVPLAEADDPRSKFWIHGNQQRALELARLQVAQRLGQAAADRARFFVIFGGQL